MEYHRLRYFECDSPAARGPGRVEGRMFVTGGLYKGGGGFRVDHPLDPENKYLSHSFVESPEMMNVYSGTVITTTMATHA